MYSHTECVSLPDISEINAGNSSPPLGIFENYPLYYTRDEYAEHLESIIDLIGAYPNYNFFVCENKLPHVTIQVKEEFGAIIAKDITPSVIFALNQPNSTDALYRRLENDQYNISAEEKSKQCVIETLTHFIDELTK